MVLIESNEIEEKIINRSEYSTNSTSESAANANRDVSDGFETASDGELEASDTDDEARHPKQLEAQQRGNKDKEEQQQQHQHERNVTEEEDDDKPIVSPTDDEEQKQKAMAQANDAKIEGNKLYGSGQYEDALSKYEFALYLAPEMPSSVELRSTCYSNRAICFLKLGKYTETVKECSKALELNPSYLKAMQRRAEAHEKLEHFEEAIADTKKMLELDPSNDQARKSIRRLEPLAEQKREKMKEEMIGKLKEMGNSVLGRFGMSVDNFKAVKDPNTGSYSISFQR